MPRSWIGMQNVAVAGAEIVSADIGDSPQNQEQNTITHCSSSELTSILMELTSVASVAGSAPGWSFTIGLAVGYLFVILLSVRYILQIMSS